jgi:prevent-host-death family protein
VRGRALRAAGGDTRREVDRARRCDYKDHMRARYRKTVGARELKTRLGGYLRAVRSGATILVTERGEPVAELRPAPRAAASLESRLNELAARGIVSRGTGRPLPPFAPIRAAGRSTSHIIRADRSDRF